MLLRVILAAFCGASFVLPCRADEGGGNDAPKQKAIRAAITRALPFLEKQGVAWIDERGCQSCHHVPFLLWTHHEARAKSFAVDAKRLGEWDEWARKDSRAQRAALRLDQHELNKLDAATLPALVKEKIQPLVGQAFATEDEFVAKLATQLTDEQRTQFQSVLVKTATLAVNHPARGGGGLDVIAQLLLGRPPEQGGADEAEFRRGLVELMGRLQQDDGSWMPGNQFRTMRRWTLPTANQATTMWAAIALSHENTTADRRSATLERAVAYVRQQPQQPDNHEWLATRILFERHVGQPDAATEARHLLSTRQNVDGGWGWTKGAASDPFTTGLTLYVLAKTGDAADQPWFEPAAKYLLAAQQADGSWRTDSRTITNAQGAERLAARDEIYRYWGTGWAVLGLLEQLPR